MIDIIHYMARKPLQLGMRNRVMQRDSGICRYCGHQAEVIDHVNPYSYVGEHEEDNLVASCWICNALVSNKLFMDFESKKKFILHGRTQWLQHRQITLWLLSELEEMGKNMRRKIESTCVVVESRDEMDAISRRLSQEGWYVEVKPV